MLQVNLQYVGCMMKHATSTRTLEETHEEILLKLQFVECLMKHPTSTRTLDETHEGILLKLQVNLQFVECMMKHATSTRTLEENSNSSTKFRTGTIVYRLGEETNIQES